jgi:hypothetical protein
VTDELALGDADADAPLLAVDEPVLDEVALDAAEGGTDELLPLLHAARPVTAASAAIPPRASWDRLLLAVAGVLSLFIGGELLCFLFFREVRAPGRARGDELRAPRRWAPGRP